MTISTSFAAKLACSFIAIFLCFTAVVQAEDIAVFDQRIDIPKPDGSGVAFIQLLHDPDDPNDGAFIGFRIKALNFIGTGTQQLKLWNPATSDCNGDVLADEDDVPEDGMVCFFSDNSVDDEFQNSFDFVAIGSGGDSTLTGTVKLVNYDKQACPGIPDLGTSGTFSAPPAPSVEIELDGLQIKFTVDTAYIRNQTSWFLDFFDFDITPATGHSADGTGHTCANHLPATYAGTAFPDWWASAPRATYTTSVHVSIENALNNAVFPNYYPQSTEWTVASVDCDTVQWVATIPISKLMRNTAGDDCKTGSGSAPAVTPTGLRFDGNLYANAIRPRTSDADGGYYKSTFLFPYSFSIQETVSNVGTISPKWSFAVNILLLDVERTTSPGLTLEIQTTLDHPTLQTPNIATFSLLSEPHTAERDAPTLSRVGDNGECDGTSTSACIITWRMVAEEIDEVTLGDPAFGLQYVGNWQFEWVTDGDGDVLQANIYIDASATDPDVDLDTLPVTSSISFFKSKTDMQTVSNPGISTPTYSSGEQIWVRHSFGVDDADVTALTFTLKEAYVCWSHVPGFVPSLSGGLQGCKIDIPGVMELSQGQRFLLYDSVSLDDGIPNVVGNSEGVLPKTWDWELVGPGAAGWTNGERVHSGFGINTMPLVTDDQRRTYYFHVVSVVSQTAKRSTHERHSLYVLRDGDVERGWLQGITVEGSESDAAHALRPSAAISWLF